MNYKKTLMKLSRLGRKSTLIRKCLLMVSEKYYLSMKNLSDEEFARRIYGRYSRKQLNLEDPQTFNDKLWWLKFNYRNSLMPVCSDKYTVRGYVTERGLVDILIPLIGVYDSFDDVPFSDFSEPVFLKCTKGSGGNAIYDPSVPFDKKTQRMIFSHKLRTDYTIFSREWNYGGTPNRIVCERVIRNKNGSLPVDYKFYCFEGKPKLLFYSENVAAFDGQHNVSGTRFTNVYDAETLELLPIMTSIPPKTDVTLIKPQHYDRMLEIAAKLSAPFPFCRVDLYNIEGQVYFGEITFFPSGGNDVIKPDEWSYRLGSWIELPSK